MYKFIIKAKCVDQRTNEVQYYRVCETQNSLFAAKIAQSLAKEQDSCFRGIGEDLISFIIFRDTLTGKDTQLGEFECR